MTVNLTFGDVSVLDTALLAFRKTGDRRRTGAEYDALAAKLAAFGNEALARENEQEKDAESGSDTVKAKDAPLGVQLWPTVSPEHAPNFTLASVIRQVGSNGREYVIWQYESGNTRMFLADEDVAVQIVDSVQ